MDLPAPMLPTAGRLPTAPGWAYEIKWDGVRVMCGVSEGRLQVQTRRGMEISDRFAELAGITEVFDGLVLDGELVVFAGEAPDWGATIRRLRAKPARTLAAAYPGTVLVFDVLRLDGEDLRGLSYTERRDILEELPLSSGWVVPPRFESGPATVAASLEHGLEGVVAKRLSSTYVSGRSRHWVKARHKSIIDTTVIGWIRRPSGGVSLLLAEETPAGLVYVGRCTAPRGVVDALTPADAAPVVIPGVSRDVQWVRPEVQVEVTAASREPDGRLRMPRFVRMRLDA